MNYAELLNTDEWKAKCYDILLRDKFVCQDCGCKGIHNNTWQCPKYCVNEKTGFRYHLLYLDSVFKYKNKLVHNQAPIMNRLCPLLLNFH